MSESTCEYGQLGESEQIKLESYCLLPDTPLIIVVSSIIDEERTDARMKMPVSKTDEYAQRLHFAWRLDGLHTHHGHLDRGTGLLSKCHGGRLHRLCSGE